MKDQILKQAAYTAAGISMPLHGDFTPSSGSYFCAACDKARDVLHFLSAQHRPVEHIEQYFSGLIALHNVKTARPLIRPFNLFTLFVFNGRRPSLAESKHMHKFILRRRPRRWYSSTYPSIAGLVETYRQGMGERL